jgi:hypothetical protein
VFVLSSGLQTLHCRWASTNTTLSFFWTHVHLLFVSLEIYNMFALYHDDCRQSTNGATIRHGRRRNGSLIQSQDVCKAKQKIMNEN